MSEDMIIRHCAPTLAGLKTGNIFTAEFQTKEDLDRDLLHLNEILNDRGLRVTLLRARCGRALVYVYRPGKLQQDLSRSEARSILEECGYTEALQENCVARLKDRVCLCADFPHEIGLFLGYPPEDVRGFIASGGRNSKACGYWKVYGDPEAARRQFERFEKCTGVYLRCLRRGISLRKLAVRLS